MLIDPTKHKEDDVLEKKIVQRTADFQIHLWERIVVRDFSTGLLVDQWKPAIRDVAGNLLGRPADMPLPGSQYNFSTCPIYEVLLAGNRGGGKTAALLRDFGKDVGKGYGQAWRGVLFRLEYKDLDDVVKKGTDLFCGKLFPEGECRFLRAKSDYMFVWKTGEALLLRHLLNEDGYDCVDEGEILTPDRGWIDIKDIQVGDAVYEVSPDRKLVESVVERKTIQDHEGFLVRNNGRGTYFSFTDNHRVGSVAADGRIWPLPFYILGEKASIGRQVTFEGGTDISDNPLGVSGDDYCEFMGWFLSEGHTLSEKAIKGHLKRTFAIAQQKPDNCKKIESLLERMGIPFTYSGHQFRMHNPVWWQHLSSFGKCRDKFISKQLKNTSTRQLRILFDALMLGDGTVNYGNLYYTTISKQLADDISEIAIKLGYTVYVSSRQRYKREGIEWTVACRASDRKDLTLSPNGNSQSKYKKELFSGKVYCIGVPKHHTFLIRQKGCVWISGNSYHGHELPWLGFEELTLWPDDKAYRRMFSCSRSSTAGIRTRVRATTNPYGPGMQWVKRRFQLPNMFGRVIREPEEKARIAINSLLHENFLLLHAEPDYPRTISQAAKNPAERAAWLYGSWDVSAGGLFDDLWDTRYHLVPSFPVNVVPSSWKKVVRSYDHGQSHPFAVIYTWESDGTPLEWQGRLIGQVRGDIIVWKVWYGSSGGINEGIKIPSREIARGIVQREKFLGIHGRVQEGPADHQIFNKVADRDFRSVADDMEDEGVKWERADKSPGSRVRGIDTIRNLLNDALPREGYREKKGLFFCESTRILREDKEFDISIFSATPRDRKLLDDSPETYEDHFTDALRYRVTWTRPFFFAKSF